MNLQSKKKYNGIEFFFREKYPEEFKEEVFINTSNIKPIESIRFSILSFDDSESRVSNTGVQDAFERLYREINRINE